MCGADVINLFLGCILNNPKIVARIRIKLFNDDGTPAPQENEWKALLKIAFTVFEVIPGLVTQT